MVGLLLSFGAMTSRRQFFAISLAAVPMLSRWPGASASDCGHNVARRDRHRPAQRQDVAVRRGVLGLRRSGHGLLPAPAAAQEGIAIPAPAVAPMKAILRRVAEEHCFTCDALVMR